MTTAAGVNFNVTCTIVAGADTDQAQTYVQTGAGWPLAVMVAHEYTAAGTADFQCSTSAAGPVANQIKIVAIKVGTLATS
jgi:hypothetical protein